MTVSSEVARWEYAGNGVTTSFAAGRVFADDELSVALISSTGVVTVLTLNTDYTVTLNVQTSSVIVSPAPAVGEVISIRRLPSLTQETSIKNQGAFFPEIHEDALDRLTMICQYLWDLTSRSIRLPDDGGDNYDAENLQIKNLANPSELGDAVNLATVQSLISAGVPVIYPGMITETIEVEAVATGGIDNMVLANRDIQSAFAINATGGTLDVSGLTAPGAGESHVITLLNASTGGHNILLRHDNVGSSALNRFTCPGAGTVTLAPYQCVRLIYVQNQAGAGNHRWVVGVSP